jgi:hypothetical protein
MTNIKLHSLIVVPFTRTALIRHLSTWVLANRNTGYCYLEVDEKDIPRGMNARSNIHGYIYGVHQELERQSAIEKINRKK